MTTHYEFLGELLGLREQAFNVVEDLNLHNDWKQQELFATLAEDLDDFDEELAEVICRVCDLIKAENQL